MSETTQSPYDSLGTGKLCVLSLDISVMSIRPLTLMFQPLLHCHHHQEDRNTTLGVFSFFSKVPWLTSVPAAGLLGKICLVVQPFMSRHFVESGSGDFF